MPTAADNALVLFPGALGDFVCFLPTLIALRARHRGRLLLVAKPPLLELVRLSHTATASMDRREVADLFVSGRLPAPATKALLADFAWVYSWTGFESPEVRRRLATVTGGQVSVYRFRGMHSSEHAIDYYARCASVAPCTPIAPFLADDVTWFESFARRAGFDSYTVIHPGSGSTRKNWQGFGAIVRHCRERGSPVVLLRGPAEAEGWMPQHGADITVGDLSLPQVAALLRRCHLYLGNDSGISHLAGAVAASGAVLFGSTDPATWAPRSDRLRILHAPQPCPHCTRETFCTHRLPVDSVIAALDGAALRSRAGMHAPRR